MEKTVLILHGWPQPITKDSMYYKYFEKLGYSVVAPRLFSNEFVLNANEAKEFILKQINNPRPYGTGFYACSTPKRSCPVSFFP
jgi:hypothetical protein